MRPIEEEVSSRQILQVSTVTRQGERDFIKLRPFAKVIATPRRADAGACRPDPRLRRAPHLRRQLRRRSRRPRPPPTRRPPTTSSTAPRSTARCRSRSATSRSAPIDERRRGSSWPPTRSRQIVRAAANFGGGESRQVAALSFVDPDGAATSDGERRSLHRDRRTHHARERLQRRQERRRATTGHRTSRRRSSRSPRARASAQLLEENDVTDDDTDEIVAALSDLVDLNRMHVGQKIRVAYAADATEGGTPDPDPRLASTTTAPIRRRSRAPTTTASCAPTSRHSRA